MAQESVQEILRHRIFDQRYEILSTIGRGQNSVVYKAVSLNNPKTHALHALISEKKIVALKVLIGSSKHPEHNLARMEREALALASSRHPNVIKLNDFVSTGELCYLSMEYADAGDVSVLLSQNDTPLETEFALRLVIQVLSALQAVHRAGIIHSDIKPENLLLTSSGVLKLGDFSVAILPSPGINNKKVSSVIGTLDYLAPETLSQGKYYIESDIYSVGVTCYQLLTKTLPFAGNSFTEQIENKMVGKMRPVTALLNDASDRLNTLDKLLSKALATDPQKRFHSASEFRHALESLLTTDQKTISLKPLDFQARQRRKTLPGIPNHRLAGDLAAEDERHRVSEKN